MDRLDAAAALVGGGQRDGATLALVESSGRLAGGTRVLRVVVVVVGGRQHPLELAAAIDRLALGGMGRDELADDDTLLLDEELPDEGEVGVVDLLLA